jgi:hypothetical protein
MLERMGLARSRGGDWEVHPDFLSILRSMKKATDRQKMLAAHASAISNPHLPIQYTPPDEIRELEGRVVGHAVDDVTGVAHMILEGNDQKIHLIPHNKPIELARHAGRLAPRTEVRLQRRGGTPLRIIQPQKEPSSLSRGR